MRRNTDAGELTEIFKMISISDLIKALTTAIESRTIQDDDMRPQHISNIYQALGILRARLRETPLSFFNELKLLLLKLKEISEEISEDGINHIKYFLKNECSPQHSPRRNEGVHLDCDESDFENGPDLIFTSTPHDGSPAPADDEIPSIALRALTSSQRNFSIFLLPRSIDIRYAIKIAGVMPAGKTLYVDKLTPKETVFAVAETMKKGAYIMFSEEMNPEISNKAVSKMKPGRGVYFPQAIKLENAQGIIQALPENTFFMFDPLTSSDVTAEAVIQLPQRRMLCIHPKSNPTFVHPLANKMPPGSVVILRDGTSTSTVTAVAKALTKGQYLTIDSSLKLAPADLIGVAIALGHEQTLNLSEFDPHHFPTDLVRKLWRMTNLILSTKTEGKVFWIHPKSNPIGEEVNRCNGSAVSEATPFDPTEAGDNDPAETTMAVEKMASAAGTEEAKPYLLNTTPNPIQLICEEVHSCNGVTVSEATPFDPTEATNPTMIYSILTGFSKSSRRQ